jgi:MYXO-CTERM domain-containing protein
MDEGSGTELFDASSSHLDGTATLTAVDAQAFGPSAAWSHRQVNEDHPMDAADAGYDADGDPVTLAIATPALHGAASVDQAALQVGYQPAASYLGADGFSFSLDDGSGPVSYAIDIAVSRVLLCEARADCGGGDDCVSKLCVPPGGVGGCGCGNGGGSGAGLWALLGLLVLALRRPRRRRA